MRRRKKYGGDLPKMILDYNMCLNVTPGDEELALPAVPYRCPRCAPSLTSQKFCGRLRFGDGPVPLCEDHPTPIEMEASHESRNSAS